DININPNATFKEQLPAGFTTFMYVIDGGVQVGEDETLLTRDEVGWLDRLEHDQGQSMLMLKAGENGARLILYAGEPQHDELVSHGPFIGETSEDIQRLYQDYRQQKMIHINDVAPEQQIIY
ncbi:MAG: pirin family protein, partial [Pedobacter sp.]